MPPCINRWPQVVAPQTGNFRRSCNFILKAPSMKSLLNRRVFCLLFLLPQPAFVQEVSFRITPLYPVQELRVEALKAEPPREQGRFRKSELVELINLDPTIKLDIRYATTNNFLGTP